MDPTKDLRKPTPIAYAVYPSEQWHKEYPHLKHETPYLWHTPNHAAESANDTDGKIVPLYGITGRF